MVFQAKLGTVYEKMERFKGLAEFLADTLKPEVKETVSRAAYLCKADLVTGMVGEFPELQGIMGRNMRQFPKKIPRLHQPSMTITCRVLQKMVFLITMQGLF